MNGRMIRTDAEHQAAEREIFSSARVPGAQRLVRTGSCVEDFLGFGLALTPGTCYELSRMEPSERTALLKQTYSREGLGLSIGRLCIGSTDYGPELYSYDEEPFDTELKHFSVEQDERYVIPMLREILAVRPDLYLFASPWSPPSWMKTGGALCGGFMREEFVDCYADYIVKFLQAYAERGIKISAVTPQNEPLTEQRGKMPACIWHPETEARFIKVLRKKLDAQGLDVKIWLHDHNFSMVERPLWLLENDPELVQACDGVAFHYYLGAPEQTICLRERFPDLPLHFTEGGPRLNDHYETDWCKWGLMISRLLKVGYRSFTGWNLVLDEAGWPNIGPYISTCGGLVTHDERTGECRYSGQYRAFEHIVPYVTPQAKIYPLCADRSFGQCVSSYPKQELELEGFEIDQGNGRHIAVVINQNAFGVQAQVELCGKLWYTELYADSIVTIMVEE